MRTDMLTENSDTRDVVRSFAVARERLARPRTPNALRQGKTEHADRGRSNGRNQSDQRGPESGNPGAEASMGAESWNPSRDRPAASRPATQVGAPQGTVLRLQPDPILDSHHHQARTPNPSRPTFSYQRAASRTETIACSKVEGRSKTHAYRSRSHVPFHANVSCL